MVRPRPVVQPLVGEASHSVRADCSQLIAKVPRPCLDIMICIALAVATVACYKNVVHSGFVHFDDDHYVTQNVWVQMGLSRSSVQWAFTTTAVANWHPLTWLSLELDYQLFGLNPAGFHAMNLAFHVANTLALYWLLRNWTAAVGRAAVAAAYFALHPLHVESVAWVSERKDVLSTLFLLLSLLAWGAYVRRKNIWAYALALLMFLLSLMAKPMGVTLPFLLLLLDLWPLRRHGGTRPICGQTAPGGVMLLAEKLPFFLVSVASAAITIVVQSNGGALDYGQSLALATRLWMVPVNYLTYLRQTLLPIGLIAFYRHPGAGLAHWKSFVAVVILTLITAVVLHRSRNRRYLPVGWFWFLISLLPVIGIIQVGEHATADRYMYLPMIGLLIGVLWGGWDLALASHSRGIIVLAAVLGLLLCAGLTFRQVAMWHDTESLFEPLTVR